MDATPRDEQWERIHLLSSRLDALANPEVARELDNLESGGNEDPLVLDYLRSNYKIKSPVPLPAEGEVLAGRYTVVGTLGEGGMGTVYRAHHSLTQRDVAVKLVHPTLIQSPAARERFRSEISLQAKLSHPGIVRVFDADVHEPSDGKVTHQVFLAMELVEGRPLSDYFGEEDTGVTEILHAVERVAVAIEHAHAAGILHLDIKPANVLVRDADGSPVVLDFGLSVAVGSAGDGGGTLAYMAPETVQDPGAPGTVATDIYATGVLLYELLAGRHPYLFEGNENLKGRIASGSRPPLKDAAPAVPKAVAAIVERAMSPRPEDRFPSMAALAESVKNARLNIENAAAYRRGIARAALVSSIIVAMLVGLAITALANAQRARAAAANAALGETRALAVSTKGAAVAHGLDVIGALPSGSINGSKAAEFRDAATALLARDDLGTPVASSVGTSSPEPLIEIRPGVLSWRGTELAHDGFPFVRSAGLAAANASGTLLVTTSPASHHVLLWDTATGRLVAFAYHPALPASVDWGGSDTRFAVGALDGNVYLWQVPEVYPANGDPARMGTPLNTMVGPAGGLRSSAYHATSRAVGMLGEDGNTIELEPGNGGHRQQLELPSECETITFSPDGLHLTAAGPDGDWLLPVRRSPVLRRVQLGAGRDASTAITAPSGRLALLDGARIRLFSLDTLQELGSRRLGVGRIIEVEGTRIALDSRDGASIFDTAQNDLSALSLENVEIPKPGSRIFAIADPAKWFTLIGSKISFPGGSQTLSSKITGGRFLPATEHIAVFSGDGLRILDISSSTAEEDLFIPGATALAAGDGYVFCAAPDGLSRYEEGNCEAVGTFPLPTGNVPHSLTYIPGRALLAVPDGRSLLLFHANDGAHAVRLPLEAAAAHVSASHCGRYVSVVGLNGVLSLWDLEALSTELDALGLPLAAPL